VSRGGLAGLNFVQQEAQRLLWQGGVLADGGLEALRQFDDELIARHLSPGGSADLLAVTWFLSAFPAGALSRCNPLQHRLRPHCTGEGAIISLPVVTT
jgi:triphosphoribosyl-dephospho-CoA synthase